MPDSDIPATRIEHRVAGADANPYLLTAHVLASMHHGIRNELDCDEPIDGNAYEQTEGNAERQRLQESTETQSFE